MSNTATHTPFTPKNASEWTQSDLSSYNITLIDQDRTAFFDLGGRLPGLPMSLDALADTADREAAVDVDDDYETEKYLHILELAWGASRNAESRGDGQGRGQGRWRGARLESVMTTFVERLLLKLGYDTERSLLLHGVGLPLAIAGTERLTRPSLSMWDADELVTLLVQTDLSPSPLSPGSGSEKIDPEAALIASAISSFQYNNRTRVASQSTPFSTIVLPGVAFTGTTPTFYRIAVTEALSKAVESGQPPEEGVEVQRYVPELPGEKSEGMLDAQNRHLLLQEFLAFTVCVEVNKEETMAYV
ncbi:unnamed protein product [Cyclocybe aegerita]|uniref:Uncharacterized protein n=1 Tax=Cyclocybe aegerita TaxID=1973307 RepID=A0A8S0VYE3_CYCAE|nr:unnamed protein product [Cyclocybe aegerita]